MTYTLSHPISAEVDSRQRHLALWAFYALTVVLHNAHDVLRVDVFQAVLLGHVAAPVVDAGVLIVATAILKAGIIVTLVCLTLPRRGVLFVQLAAASLAIGLTVFFGGRALDDLWFRAVELATLITLVLSIIWTLRRT